jgi:hypothetical protein
MLDLNPETVQFIIERAREFQVREEPGAPEEPDPADWSSELLATYAEDPIFQELKATIEDLEPDQQVSVVALMWLGRGDYTADEWSSALRRAGESWNERTAEYLIGTPLLADYLAEGLEQLEQREE